jgi:hypothetical protein
MPPTLWKVKDDATWWKTLPKVTSFEPGDVFITKYYAWASKTMNIRKIGMAVLSHHRQSSAASAHAGMFVQDNKLLHIVGYVEIEGVDVSDFSQYPNVVWRCKDKNLAKLATQTALRLCGCQGLSGLSGGGPVTQSIDSRPNFRGPVFDETNAVKAVFRNRYVTAGVKDYLIELESKLRDSPTGGTVDVPDLFCAELVVAAYEIASRACGTPAFGVDPRSVDPKFLESLLNQSDQFELIGRFGDAG